MSDTQCQPTAASPSDARCRLWSGSRADSIDTPCRLLVVDDNALAAEALGAFLTTADMECREVFGGLDAVACGKQWQPHIVLMDISMPECNGFQAALALRADARTRNIAIIACTALDETEVRRHLSDHEFDGYFQKGQPLDRLLALIWKMIRGGGSLPLHAPSA